RRPRLFENEALVRQAPGRAERSRLLWLFRSSRHVLVVEPIAQQRSTSVRVGCAQRFIQARTSASCIAVAQVGRRGSTSDWPHAIGSATKAQAVGKASRLGGS